MFRDLKNPIARSYSHTPQSISGSSAVNGTIVDGSNFAGPIAAVFINAAASGSPSAQAHTVKLQHGTSANGSDMSDISGASTTITADSQVTVIQTPLRSKRYVRAVVTPAFTSGSSPAVLFTSVIEAQKQKY